MLRLPERAGTRPRTSGGIPHRQLDQGPPPDVYQRLRQRLENLPLTEPGDSLVSVPGARALFLPACERCNARYGFIRGREFAHLHPPEDGSLHMTLAPDDMAEVLRQGWGEPHPWVGNGRILPTVAMVFAPRAAPEIEIVLDIVAASLDNARAAVGPLQGDDT